MLMVWDTITETNCDNKNQHIGRTEYAAIVKVMQLVSKFGKNYVIELDWHELEGFWRAFDKASEVNPS